MDIGNIENKRWTREEIIFLENNYPSESWDYILLHLTRFDKNAIISKASDLKIRRSIAFWSDSDVFILKQAYKDNISNKKIQKMLENEHSVASIATKANKLGLYKSKKWTESEQSLLLEYYENTPTDELLEMFPGRTIRKIQDYARKLGLHSNTYLTRQWTDENDKYIADNWETKSDQEMANEIGRTMRSIKYHREQLGLYKDVPSGNYEYLRKYLWKTNRDWRKKSIEACQYRCIVTGDRFQAVHHLYGSNLIVKEALDILGLDYGKVETYSETELFRIANTYAELHDRYPLGVCLSDKIHVQFHNEYGYGNNTPAQFIDFLNHNYPTSHIPVTIKSA